MITPTSRNLAENCKEVDVPAVQRHALDFIALHSTPSSTPDSHTPSTTPFATKDFKEEVHFDFQNFKQKHPELCRSL